MSALVGAVCSALISDKALAGRLWGWRLCPWCRWVLFASAGGAMALYVVLTSGDGWHLAVLMLFNVVLLLLPLWSTTG